MEENYRSLITTAEVRSTALVKSMANAAAAQLSIRWGMMGPNITYSVACSSSAIAIGEAWRCIRHGEIDVALAGGTETPLTEGVVRSWAAMRILARAQAGESEPRCRPFSTNRNGLLLGEGAAFFVLEDEEAARARGAVIHARLTGYAASADASHITAPSPEGQARTMRRALANAGIATGEIGYVNAHGTGTLNGDVSEARALHLVFGDHASRIPVSATKSAHGHLIGAAGALELIPAILAVRDGLIAPTIHFDAPDSDCHLDCVPNQAREDRSIRHALSNSFAFGGSNAALVVSRFD
jgi:3-oxoacyl-(acyl-carrier-protein) synthase